MTIAIIFAIPIIINNAYFIGQNEEVNTWFTASDLINYAGMSLAFMGTLLISAIAILQNRELHKQNIRLENQHLELSNNQLKFETFVVLNFNNVDMWWYETNELTPPLTYIQGKKIKPYKATNDLRIDMLSEWKESHKLNYQTKLNIEMIAKPSREFFVKKVEIGYINISLFDDNCEYPSVTYSDMNCDSDSVTCASSISEHVVSFSLRFFHTKNKLIENCNNKKLKRLLFEFNLSCTNAFNVKTDCYYYLVLNYDNTDNKKVIYTVDETDSFYLTDDITIVKKNE